MSAIIVLGTVILYLTIMVGVGEYARRRTTLDCEDYLVASWTFGTAVLFFALVATMIGFPGSTYQLGEGMYGWFLGSFSS